MDYIKAEIPNSYWAKKITYLCQGCGLSYSVLMPVGNEVVKYLEKNGSEERWLPTYTKGGYFDLLEKLIDGFSRDNEITASIAKEFENKFSSLQEFSSKGNSFTSIFNIHCPGCGSREKLIDKEESVKNPDVYWMRYRSI